MLQWPDCRNVRDIGGLPTADGRQTRDRILVRADSLDRLTEAGVAVGRDYGVSTVIDLRSPWEMPVAPHPFASHPGYRLLSFIDAERDRERDPTTERDLADLYRGSIDRNGRCVTAAVGAIAKAPPGIVVVHCLSGADRTGMLVALLLDTLGIDRSAIVQDYDRTRACLAADATSYPGLETQHTLRHLDNQWGGSRSYRQTHGVDTAQINALADRILTD
jgi:hypothetical protein